MVLFLPVSAGFFERSELRCLSEHRADMLWRPKWQVNQRWHNRVHLEDACTSQASLGDSNKSNVSPPLARNRESALY
jgi:hypothetical protein